MDGAAKLIPAIPKWLSTDGGWEDMEHISFLQVITLEIAQGYAVQQNK
jgi:hypothetical protein